MNSFLKNILTISYFAYALAFTIISCNQSVHKDSNSFNRLTVNLENSNNIIFNDTRMHYYEMQKRLNSPIDAPNIGKWFNSVEALMVYSQQAFDSIEYLKKEIDHSVILENIKKLISRYRQNITQLNSKNEEYLSVTVKKYLSIDSSGYLELPNDLMVAKFQNDVRSVENYYVSYYNSITSPSCNLGMITGSLLVGQSTNHLKKGEKLEISAGVGQYFNNCNLYVQIDGKSINDSMKNGFVTYKLIPQGNVGKHKLPVIINYVNNKGEHIKDTLDVEYTIDN